MTETETVTLTKEVLVPVPDELTRPVEIPKLPPNPDTLQLSTTYKATLIRLLIANGQLKEIGELGK